ncbi:MAG: GGDEF domain-containing protein [Actinomycetota bacterium]
MSRRPSEVSGNGDRAEAELRAQLAQVSRSREQIAKAWLVEVILNSSLAEVAQMPMAWAAEELPELINDILAAVGDGGSRPDLGEEQLMRAGRLAELRGAAASPEQVAREVSSLHTAVLSTLREQLSGSEPELFGEAAERLAALFGQLNGATVGTLLETTDSSRDSVTGLPGSKPMRLRLEQMVAGAKRYGHPFALVVLDVEGPSTREESNGSGHEAVLAVVSAALRGSIRVVDEAYLLDDGELCVLAANQTAAEATRMAHRLAALLARLEEAGGLRITVSAGVAACPEHGDEPERLLRQADTAMWRARATGQPVTIGALQDR